MFVFIYKWLKNAVFSHRLNRINAIVLFHLCAKSKHKRGQDSARKRGQCSAMHSYNRRDATGGAAAGAASASNETYHGDATLHQVQHHLRKAKP